MILVAMMPAVLALSTAAFTPTVTNCRNASDPKAAAAQPNDNRIPAGKLVNGVQTIRLVARPAGWYPEGPAGCGIRVHAFAEEGKPTQIPGPLIRVRAGTEVHILVRNELGMNLKVRGLVDRRLASSGALADRQSVEAREIEILAGQTREVRFRPTVQGTFYYWGVTPFDTINAFPNRPPGAPLPYFSPFEDSQLGGALIIDPPNGSPPDRVFVMTHWLTPRTDFDEAARGQLNAMNGLSWPHTEQLAASVGDTLRWRVVNLSTAPHTMHLHGFYFRVLSGGNLSAFDSIYTPEQQRNVVSEFMVGTRTMTLEWVPERSGNWLFHCHWVAHMGPHQRLERLLGPEQNAMKASDHHEGHDMAGLVLGVSIKGRSSERAAAAPKRKLRLYAAEKPNVFGTEPGFGFVLQEGASPPARDSIRIPGTPMMLTKDEPTQITVFNRLSFPLAVHWHGIELDSYYDGVPGFSGAPKRVSPAIAPGDSFVVRMTPPRAGTFMYHVHSELANELNSGLYGALVVVDPAKPHDSAIDRTFVVSAGGRGRTANQTILVNGTTKPPAIEMKLGTPQRWRFVVISANGTFDIRINGANSPTWRLLARDGADLGLAQITERRAQMRVATGSTVDFEFNPSVPGDYELQVDLPRGATGEVLGFATRIPVRVVANSPAQDSPGEKELLERALAMLLDETRWQSGPGIRLNALLWVVTCRAEAESRQRETEMTPSSACKDAELIDAPASADRGTLAMAQARLKEAIERIEKPRRN